jgi:hypothetical protein
MKRGDNTFEVVLDTGCTFAMTHDLNDFVTEPVFDDWGKVQTALTTMSLTAFGTIHWNIQTTAGHNFILTVPGFYVPGFTVQLLSPQDYVRYHGLSASSGQYGGNSKEFWLNLQDGHSQLQAPIVFGSKLPIVAAQRVTPSCSCLSSSINTESVNIYDDSNHNLTTTQKFLLLDHCRLGHLNFKHQQSFYRPNTHTSPSFKQGESNTSLSFKQGESTTLESCLLPKVPGLRTCAIPHCKACLLSKAKRCHTPGKLTIIDHRIAGALKRDDILPGDKISMDHYQSSVRGRLEYTKGHENDVEQYIGGTIFVDHASGLIFTQHQPTLGSGDTSRSLGKLEQFFSDHNVSIKGFHTDNGVFTSSDFRTHLMENNYCMKLSGVGAHHQNGVAERAIQTVMWKARTMMIHLQIMWPDHFKANLWSFAVTYTAWLHNHTPTEDSGFAPIELFSGVKLHCHDLRRIRVFGCPAYVLDPRLQDGFKIPKWEPRARLGQFLGFSSSHSTTIGTIRNLRTGYVAIPTISCCL